MNLSELQLITKTGSIKIFWRQVTVVEIMHWEAKNIDCPFTGDRTPDTSQLHFSHFSGVLSKKNWQARWLDLYCVYYTN